MSLPYIRLQLLIGGMLVCILIAIGVFYFVGNDKTPTQPASWETYTDPSYDFSLKFPESWTFTKVDPEDSDIIASYVLTDPSTTTAQQKPEVLAAVHVNTRPYIQVVTRVESDILAVSGETITLKTADGKQIQGTRYKGNAELLPNPMDATVIPLSDRTLVIYVLSNSDIYTEVLNAVASTVTLH